MNFIAAIQHATIGYGIRRKAWHENSILHLGDGAALYWTHSKYQVALLGTDHGFDVNAADIAATDWEAI